MKINIIILGFLLFSFLNIQSQERGILLEKHNSKGIDFLKENKRIKVVTLDGQKYYGRFIIIDENTISINNQPIQLDSINKIKRKSLTATITAPLLVTTGVLFILGGAAVAGTSTYGALAAFGLIPSGFALSLIPLISNKHDTKNWDYKIAENPYK